MDVADGFAGASEGWRQRLDDAIDGVHSGRRGMRIINMGDSIATGAWGVHGRDHHYVAVAAREIGRRLGASAAELVGIGDGFPEGPRLYGAPDLTLAPGVAAPGQKSVVQWFTSGIGATRAGDLAHALTRDGGRGAAAYACCAPDLLIVEIGVNDSIHADVEALEDSVAALEQIVRCLVVHDLPLALVGAVPVRDDFQPGPWRAEQLYAEAYRPLSARYGVPLLEPLTRWGGYDSAHRSGYIADQVHPTAAGHRDLAAAITALVLDGRRD